MTLMFSKLLNNSTFLRRIFHSSNDRDEHELKIYKELTFENFISDEDLIPYYMEFLKDEYAEELLLFYLDVQKYKTMKIEEQRQKQKKKIFQEYIDSKTAKFEITLSYKLKKSILDKGKQQEDENLADENLFEDVERYIVTKPLRETFMRFTGSKIFLDLKKQQT